MIHALRYGDHTVHVELPDDQVDLIVAESIPDRDEAAIILEALDSAKQGLQDFLDGSDSVLVVVSDHTRNTGSRVYMPILLDQLRKPGRRITILIALGLHRPSTGSEITNILGCEPGEDVTVLNHDADSNLAQCGEGLFCSHAVGAKKIILTGSVAFHPMAGYSGGRKSLLPGIASRASIIGNHRLYFSGGVMDPGVGPAQLRNNPIHSDILRRTAGFDGRIWSLNVVQNELKSIVFAAAGHVDEAWAACTEFLSRINSPKIPHAYPVVLATAGGYPSDFSFYQSMKTLTNASRACLKGGTIFLLMECRNGWEMDPEVLAWGQLDLGEIALRIQNNFSMSALAMYMALSVIRDYRVFCLSSLREREVVGLGMRYLAAASDIGNLVRDERERSGTDRIAVIPAAAAILPVIGQKIFKGDKYAP